MMEFPGFFFSDWRTQGSNYKQNEGKTLEEDVPADIEID